MTTHKEALEAAYLAGFNASGEGYNGEYPFGDKMQDPAENRVWKKDRDNYIKEALAQPEQEPTNLERHERNVQKFLGTQQPKEPKQEPVVLRFNEWTVSKNDLSDHICVGELTFAGIEDNLEGPEFGEVEIERFDDVIDALQEKLVTGRECKRVPLIAYIGANNTTPQQRTWVGLTIDEMHQLNDALNLNGRFPIIAAIEAKLREKNT